MSNMWLQSSKEDQTTDREAYQIKIAINYTFFKDNAKEILYMILKLFT